MSGQRGPRPHYRDTDREEERQLLRKAVVASYLSGQIKVAQNSGVSGASVRRWVVKAGHEIRQRGRPSAQDIDKMLDLRESGLTCKQVAEALGASHRAVEYHCRMKGVDAAPVGAAIRRRDGSIHHRFSKEEDELVVSWSIRGLKPAAIARLLTKKDPDRPRSRSGIHTRLQMLAQRERRNDPEEE